MSNGETAQGDGHTISIDGIQYPKGLGVHADSVVQYDLEGRCSAFAAVVGVDDEVYPNGSVVFQVFGDDVKLYDSGILLTSSARSIAVDLTGRRELRLVVTDAGDGNNSDHADWANARITCQ